MYKKTISKILVFALIFILAGCSGNNEAGEEGAGNDAPKVNLVMGTGGVSGTWYPVGGALCAAMSKVPGINATAQTSAAGVENIRLVSSGDRQLGMAMPSLGVYAREGIEAFEGAPIDNIRGIAMMIPMEATLVVRADSGIKTIEDIKGKSIGTGAPGSGDEVAIREILTACGMSYDDVNEKMLSFSEQTTAFKDRQLDVMFMLTASPTAAVMDVASQADIAFVEISGNTRQKILEKYSYYYESRITPEAYSFLEKDAETIGIGTMLFTSTDVDEDTIYKITKAMFDNIGDIQAAHATMKTFSLETALNGMAIDLHPGAIKYYKEVGLL